MGRAEQQRHRSSVCSTDRVNLARGAWLTRAAVMLLVALSWAAAHPSRASAATCSGFGCTSLDPYMTGCNAGDSVAGSSAIIDGAGQTIGTLRLYWSSTCQANWGQASFDDGNPAGVPPVEIVVYGSSSAATYDTGSVAFTAMGPGNPVWGNMVYSPGCAYATIKRGDATGKAVQLGCPGAPGAPMNPSTIAKCSGLACTGQDPYATGCQSDASVAGSSAIVDGTGRTLGTLKLYWSHTCQTNWGAASFDDGNPASTPPVDIKVFGTDASAPTPYNIQPVDFPTTGAGSPVWGNMIYSPGCAYATVTRGDAAGTAVQEGCPPASSRAPQAAPYALMNVLGTSAFTVTGGETWEGEVADFTDPDPTATSADFAATINWGDGTQTDGTIHATSTGFFVTGEHLYADPTVTGQATEGGHTITVTISDIGGGPDGGGGTATTYSSVEVMGRGISPPPPDQGNQPTVLPSSSDKPQAGGLGAIATVGGVAGCGAAGVADFFTLGALTPFTGFLCATAAAGVGAEIITLDDPPDRHFRTVFRARPLAVPALPKRCAQLKGARCVSLRTTLLRYLRAYAFAAAFTEDVGVTANRYGGALVAHDHAAAGLQRRVEKRYFARWRAAIEGRQAAGRTLAIVLLHDHLDRRFSAAQITMDRQRLVHLTGLSKATLSRLKHEGLISGPADVIAMYKRFLGWGPRPADVLLSSLLTL
jgi:hypothetical protein